MWASFFGSIFSTTAKAIDNHYERKAQRQARADALTAAQSDARIRMIEQDNQHAISMDMLMTQGAQGKRDLSFYAACVPIAMAFIPATHDAVIAGFTAIESMPDWYRYGLALMLVSVWGYRRLLRTLLNRRMTLTVNGHHPPKE